MAGRKTWLTHQFLMVFVCSQWKWCCFLFKKRYSEGTLMMGKKKCWTHVHCKKVKTTACGIEIVPHGVQFIDVVVSNSAISLIKLGISLLQRDQRRWAKHTGNSISVTLPITPARKQAIRARMNPMCPVQYGPVVHHVTSELEKTFNQSWPHILLCLVFIMAQYFTNRHSKFCWSDSPKSVESFLTSHQVQVLRSLSFCFTQRLLLRATVVVGCHAVEMQLPPSKKIHGNQSEWRSYL